MAFLVGVGITLLAVIDAGAAGVTDPAGRGDAARARLRGAAAPSASSSARSSTVVGAVMFLVGLFVRPGGTPGLIALAGGGALLMFLGVASVSSTVARPVTKMIGWPVAKVFKAPGQLASENAGRAPRRTSATVAALMIGVALVSAVGRVRRLAAQHVREGDEPRRDGRLRRHRRRRSPCSRTSSRRRSPRCPSSRPCPACAARRCTSTATRRCSAPATRWPSSSSSTSVSSEGTGRACRTAASSSTQDPADDLDLEVGSTVEATFQNGEVRELPVAGIYSDAYLVGNWLMSSTVLSETVVR